jgi:OOP family OmpA-OmpF porin
MVLDPFHYRYLAAQSKQDGRVSSIAIVVSPDSNKRIRSQVSVILPGELEKKMVDAEQMQYGPLEDGHIALYGIYFDSDKAPLKAESTPTLNKIAKLLKGNPEFRIILVGHTDNQGA